MKTTHFLRIVDTGEIVAEVDVPRLAGKRWLGVIQLLPVEDPAIIADDEVDSGSERQV